MEPGSSEAERASLAAEISGCSAEVILALKENPLISPASSPFNRGGLKRLLELLIEGNPLNEEDTRIFSNAVTIALRDKNTAQKFEVQGREASYHRKNPVPNHDYVSLSREPSLEPHAAADSSEKQAGNSGIYEYEHLAPATAAQEIASITVQEWIRSHSLKLNEAVNALIEEILKISQFVAPQKDSLSRLRFSLNADKWPENLTKENRFKMEQRVNEVLGCLRDSGLSDLVRAAFRVCLVQAWSLHKSHNMTNVKNLGLGISSLLAERMEDLTPQVPDGKDKPVFLFLLHSEADNVRKAADELIRIFILKQIRAEEDSFNWRRENTFAEPWVKVKRELKKFLDAPQFKALVRASQGEKLQRPTLVFDYTYEIIDQIRACLPDLIAALRNPKSSAKGTRISTIHEADIIVSLDNILHQIENIQKIRPRKKTQSIPENLAYNCVRMYWGLIQGIFLASADEFFKRHGDLVLHPSQHEDSLA